MKLSNTAYNWLKRAALVWLPALATLYGTLGATVGVPKVAAVIGVISAVDAFLGVMLGVSTSMHNAQAAQIATEVSGIITVFKNADGTSRLSWNITQDLDEIEKLATAHFQVKQATTPLPVDGPGR